MARLKKGVAPRAASQPPAAKPGGRDAADDKGVGATSHPPPRIPAPHKWPLLNDAAAPALPAAGAAAAGGIRDSGQTPRRKPLPHVAVLGARPAKPRRPPGVDLEKFHRAAAPGEPGRTDVGSRSAVLGTAWGWGWVRGGDEDGVRMGTGWGWVQDECGDGGGLEPGMAWRWVQGWDGYRMRMGMGWG